MSVEGLLLYDGPRVQALHLPYLEDVKAGCRGGRQGKPMDARIATGLGSESGSEGPRLARHRDFDGAAAGEHHEGVIGARSSALCREHRQRS
jgi:hypothetical protein